MLEKNLWPLQFVTLEIGPFAPVAEAAPLSLVPSEWPKGRILCHLSCMGGSWCVLKPCFFGSDSVVFFGTGDVFDYMEVSWNGGTPSYHPFEGDFPWNKRSIWGFPNFWNSHEEVWARPEEPLRAEARHVVIGSAGSSACHWVIVPVTWCILVEGIKGRRAATPFFL